VRTPPVPLLFAGAALLLLGAPAIAESQKPVSAGPVTYRFVERLGGTPPVILEGTFTIAGDTVWVEANWGECLWSQSSSKTRLAYECGRVLITFDRIDPLNRADYQAPVTVNERVEVCEEYTVNASGQRVCTSMKRDLVEKEVTRSGRFRPRRDEGPPESFF
jgi:hypothetical protein